LSDDKVDGCIVAERSRSPDAGELAFKQHDVRVTERTASNDDT